jgi:hypothetical protein
MRCAVLLLLACGLAGAQSAPDADSKKARQERLSQLRKLMGSSVLADKLAAIHDLGELTDDEAISVLAGKLGNDVEAVRIAAAKAIANHRKPASVRALANALPANQSSPEVLKAFIAALQDLDLCSSIPVLMALAEINKNALGEDALRALGKLGCTESVGALVSFLQRAEIEEKKPDIFEGTDDAPESENKMKNKALAALAPQLRELLGTLTGKTFANSREWAAAIGSGRMPLKRTAVYFCTLKETSFEVPSGKSKKCPYDDGKTLHEDVFLKHLTE